MPRAQLSAPGRIVDFFRTSDLQNATLVLDLCKDAVRERLTRSQKAKDKAQESRQTVGGPAPAAPVAQAGPKKVAKKKAKAKARKSATPRSAVTAPSVGVEEEPPLPLDEMAEDAELQPV